MKMPLFAAAALVLSLAACGDAAEENRAETAEAAAPEGTQAGAKSIGDALAQSPEHARFLAAAEQAGLTETLRDGGPYTVFVPNDAAFAGADGDASIDLIGGHIAPGAVMREDLAGAAGRGPEGRAELATVGGGTITIERDGDQLFLTDGSGARARIVEADQIRSNGVVHTIDAVLRPAG